LGIYPRSEELIEATRKNTSNLSSLFLKETKEYISLQKKAKLGYVTDPLLKWDDIYRPFAQLKSVKFAALNRIYEMNTIYRKLAFNNGVMGGGTIVKSNLAFFWREMYSLVSFRKRDERFDVFFLVASISSSDLG